MALNLAEKIGATGNFIFGVAMVMPLEPLMLAGIAASIGAGSIRLKPTLAGMFAAVAMIALPVALDELKDRPQPAPQVLTLQPR